MLRLQPSARVSLSPLRLSTTLLFAVVATITVGIVGFLVRSGALLGIAPGVRPLQETFPAWGVTAFAVWMALAVLTSVVLPVLALVCWRRDGQVRAVLGPYLGLLAVQIPTEVIFAQIFFPNITAITGIVYTGYRLYQLWYFQQAFAQQPQQAFRDRAVRNILIIGICFWSANLVFLVGVLLTRVVVQSYQHVA